MQYFMKSVCGLLANSGENSCPVDFKQNALTLLTEIFTRLVQSSCQITLDHPPRPSAMPAVFHEFTSSSISFAGVYTGELAIHCATELADLFYVKLTGADCNIDYADRGDALAEFVNFMAGDIKQLLSSSGDDIFLSVPTSIVGTRYWLSNINHQNKVTLSCQIQGLPLYITFTLQSSRRVQAAVRELSKKREWLELAVERGDLGLWSFELPSGNAEFSSHWVEMLGYKPGELEPNISAWQKIVHPDDSEQVLAALKAHIDGKSRLFEAEHRLACKNGDWLWCSVRGKIRESLGNRCGRSFYGILLDINNLKQYEQELRQINEQLEMRVSEEVAKNRAMDKLVMQQDKLSSVGLLAAGVAHEINNPIGYIISNLRSMRRYLSDLSRYCLLSKEFVSESKGVSTAQDLEALQQEIDLDYILSDLEPLLSESLEGAERVRTIVQDLKNFAREDDSIATDADLNQLVRSSLNMVTNELKYVAKVQFKEGKLPSVCCSSQKIVQVITNLLLNAAHAIEQFGTITISTYMDYYWAVLEIADTGKGIEADIINKIFDPFFTTKDVGKGTGLGLSISYEIINRHNGKIDVISKPGVGTTFTIRLPVCGLPDNVNSGSENVIYKSWNKDSEISW